MSEEIKDMPKGVQKALKLIETYTDRNNHKDWVIGGICSRSFYEKSLPDYSEKRKRELLKGFIRGYRETEGVCINVYENHRDLITKFKPFEKKFEERAMLPFEFDPDYYVDELCQLSNEIETIVYYICAESEFGRRYEKDHKDCSVDCYIDYLHSEFCFDWIEDDYFLEITEIVVKILQGDPTFDEIKNLYINHTDES